MVKQYTLIAGVNGAGKSTFYLSHPEFLKELYVLMRMRFCMNKVAIGANKVIIQEVCVN